jgi:hypothetical protein
VGSRNVDVDSLTREQILDMLPQLTAEMDEIRTQIEDAKAKAASTGDYADREWFRRAKYALRAKGRLHQQLQYRLGVLRKERSTQSTEVEKQFVNVAREVLPDEQFHRILQTAMGRANGDSDS